MRHVVFVLTFAALCLGSTAALEAQNEIPRRADGKPDFTGTYDRATLTPLTRPFEFGDKLYMTREEADALAAEAAEVVARGSTRSDADREAPPEGGSAPVGQPDALRETNGGGSVGGYNLFWIDQGQESVVIDGKIRTSIIYEPKNGQMPPMTPLGMATVTDNLSSFLRPNDGTAWWLDGDAPGPFDGPEDLALFERCLLGFSAGPPLVPGLYNNFIRIVQTDDHVMILAEMVHDARVIRFADEHDPDDVRKWLGDAIARWEGDTLVIESRNYREDSGLFGGSEELQLTEKLTLLADGDIRYDFTVDNPAMWRGSWSGEYLWRSSDKKVYEYACHEGNYAMTTVLRGARLLEKEALEKTGNDESDD